ncbi:anti-sigma factor family protein [Methylocapsa palsarum]|uniref:Transmembrane transcriptional regulator (Anti-sigma factor RsiW) n=1 Tax=Methylocapsa palsarum TaxID=1612308 RepID=A0A1I3YWT8_9HYPH|nr:anti-sigma factor [Methylocapsa palsarum]SFK35666.1 Transmembrane transcriptional regulator (anti-sigma factor RsiW) [Methylocapsa palsarum]
MTTSPPPDPTLLLQAALDGELDAAGMIEIEARLAADPALAAQYARLGALRDSITARASRPRAPDSLRARITSMTQTGGEAQAGQNGGQVHTAQVLSMTRPTRSEGRTAPRSNRSRWLDAPYRSLAASLMLGIALGAGASGLFTESRSGSDVERAIVAGFIRGRLSGQSVDVATSDRHTVKPWLAGKIPGATTVVDLAKDGFPLVGGRIDVAGATPLPTLVYQRREHQIALSETSAPAGENNSPPRRERRDGYSILRWTDNGRAYLAVSDLPAPDLDAFGVAFRRAAAAEREETPKR